SVIPRATSASRNRINCYRQREAQELERWRDQVYGLVETTVGQPIAVQSLVGGLVLSTASGPRWTGPTWWPSNLLVWIPMVTDLLQLKPTPHHVGRQPDVRSGRVIVRAADGHAARRGAGRPGRRARGRLRGPGLSARALLRGAVEGFPVEYEGVARDLAVAYHEIVRAERRLAGRGEQPVQDQHAGGILEHGSLLPTWLNAHRERRKHRHEVGMADDVLAATRHEDDVVRDQAGGFVEVAAGPRILVGDHDLLSAAHPNILTRIVSCSRRGHYVPDGPEAVERSAAEDRMNAVQQAAAANVHVLPGDGRDPAEVVHDRQRIASRGVSVRPEQGHATWILSEPEARGAVRVGTPIELAGRESEHHAGGPGGRGGDSKVRAL